MAGAFNLAGSLSIAGDGFTVRPSAVNSQPFTINSDNFTSSIYAWEGASRQLEFAMLNPSGVQTVDISTNNPPKFPTGADNKVTCWKTLSAGGRQLGYCSTVVDSSGGCTCN
jgi:hypothetical protein